MPNISFQDAFGEEIAPPRGESYFRQTLPAGWDTGIKQAQAELAANEKEKERRTTMEAFERDWRDVDAQVAAGIASGGDPAQVAAAFAAPVQAKWATFSNFQRQQDALNGAEDWDIFGGQNTGYWRVNKKTGEAKQIVGPVSGSTPTLSEKELYATRRALMSKDFPAEGDAALIDELNRKIAEFEKRSLQNNSTSAPDTFSEQMFPSFSPSRKETGFMGTPGGQNAFRPGDPSLMVPRAITSPVRQALSQPAAANGLQVGEVRSGWRYIGGNPSQRSSWEKL